MMADDVTLFRARAAAEQANADGADLANVRDRSTRAAKAWTDMANRAERTQVQRAAREETAAANRVSTLPLAASADETADDLDDDSHRHDSGQDNDDARSVATALPPSAGAC